MSLTDDASDQGETGKDMRSFQKAIYWHAHTLCSDRQFQCQASALAKKKLTTSQMGEWLTRAITT